MLAIAAPLVAQHVTGHEFDQQDLTNVFAGPSNAHWVGTDELGRDTLTRLVYGARVSLGVGFLTAFLYILIGGSIGTLSGYYGGLLDSVLMRLVDVVLAIPSIYLLILITSILPLTVGPITITHDAISLSIVIAVTSWPSAARLVRAESLVIRNRDYVLAARSVGMTDLRLMTRHLLPNILPLLIVVGSLAVAAVILLEAALDFIGLGVQPPTPTWGNMLLNSQRYLYHSIGLVILPGAFIFISVLAVNVFGAALRDALDPSLS